MNYRKLIRRLAALKRNVGRKADKIRKIQEKKLRMMLRYAYENSSYYSKAFSDAGITPDNT